MTPNEAEKKRDVLEEDTPGEPERTRGEQINRRGPAHGQAGDEAKDPDVDLYTSAEVEEQDEA